MPKKVKTKKQKILADTRRKTITSISKEAELTTFSLPKQSTFKDISSPRKQISVKTINNTNTPLNVSTAGYQFLVKDLRKTIILTVSIIIVQLVINHFVQ